MSFESKKRKQHFRHISPICVIYFSSRHPNPKNSFIETQQQALLKALSHILILVFTLACALSGEESNKAQWPLRPIKVIVPFGAGGGSDTFARQLIRNIEEQNLLPQPLVVINVGGAGGTIGSRRVRYARPDGYTMLMLHEGMLTAKHAGKAAYGPEAFEAVAATGRIGVVVTVRNDSKYDSLKSLMEQAKASPDSLNFAANIGAPSHFIGMILEKSLPGARFNFVQYGGGADRYGAIMGDHVQMSIFSIEEYLRYKEGGLKALAVFSAERHPALPDLPTAIEQGFEVNTTNMHFWWMPKGTPANIQNTMAQAIDQAMQSEGMKKFLSTSWTEPITLKGEALQKEIATREGVVSAVSLRKVDVLPKFEYWVLAVLAFLGILSFLKAQKNEGSALAGAMWNATSLKVYGLTLVYVAILSLGNISYPILTVPFTLVLGVIVAPKPKQSLLPLMIYALTLSCGLFYLFTRVLVVDLPG